jgi:hypothetical protein
MQHTENIHFIGHTVCINHRAPPANPPLSFLFVQPTLKIARMRALSLQCNHTYKFPPHHRLHTQINTLPHLCPRSKPAISVLCVSTSFPGRWQEKAVFHANIRVTFVENFSCATLQLTALPFICRYYTTQNRVGKASRRNVGGTGPNMVK